jgi:hypothetical protein
MYISSCPAVTLFDFEKIRPSHEPSLATMETAVFSLVSIVPMVIVPTDELIVLPVSAVRLLFLGRFVFVFVFVRLNVEHVAHTLC